MSVPTPERAEIAYEYRVVCPSGDDGGDLFWSVEQAREAREELDDDGCYVTGSVKCPGPHTIQRRDPRAWEDVPDE